MLLRIGIEVSENLRGGCLLQLYSRYQAQDVVPILFDELGIDVTRGFDLPRRTVDVAAAFVGIQPLALEVFEPRGIGKPEQVANAENGLTETKGIRRVKGGNSGRLEGNQLVDGEVSARST